MDGSRFDQIARTFASQRSRRGVIGGLAGLAAGLIGATRAGAVTCPPGQYLGSANRCLCLKTGRPPVGGSCGSCSVGLINCGGNCVDLNTDADNCGVCSLQCSEGQVCLSGTCCSLVNGPCQSNDDCCNNGFCNRGTCAPFPPSSASPTFG
jgi:hypothetical protein